LRDFVISLAPSLKTEQHASHLNSWSQIRGPLQDSNHLSERRRAVI
jgi:hypothetical protein